MVAAAPMLGDEQLLASVVVALPCFDVGRDAALERARTACRPYGARVEKLADGTIVAALSGRGGARDQAALATRCALALRDVLGSGRLALATGRATCGAGVLAGEAINRAVALLTEGPSRIPIPAGGGQGVCIAIDAVTARLVRSHFDIVASPSHGLLLLGPQSPGALDAARTLRGRPTPFVGRAEELRELRYAVESCVRDSAARAALVVAPSGGGKSRLAAELLRDLQGTGAAEIWIARGDPMTAGSPFGMLAQVVHAAADIVEGDTLRARRTKLLSRLSRHLPAPETQRVAEFLGELAGIRFQEANSVPLRAARRSRVLMADQMRRAWGDFLAAECAARPVILVLEDLHWGDAPTVTLVDSALRALRECPLFVLALARPEVHELFPALWADHAPAEVQLGELGCAASDAFVRAVAGADLDEPTRRRIVDQAGGNPFYLEELVRSAVERVDEEPPATVLAMVQSRLERLDPRLRRVLRAASVFGTTFWRGGVEALLGDDAPDASVGGLLAELETQELVTRRRRGKFRDEYVFRHDLVREAAYTTATDEGLARAHGAAGDWLERAGETDPMMLAEHFARGGDPRAGSWYVRAAKQAFEVNDLAAVVARAEAGLALGATTNQDVGLLRVLQAEARRWRGEMAEAERCALDAMRILPERSAGWFDAAGELASAASRLYHYERLEKLVEPLCAYAEASASARQIAACATVAVPLVVAGRADSAARLLDQVARADPREYEGDLDVVARVHRAQAMCAFFEGDVVAGLELTERTIAAFEGAGDQRRACLQRMNAGYAQMMLGVYAQSETTLRAALAAAQRLGIATVASPILQNLGLVLALRGSLHEARATETSALEMALEQGDAHVAALSHAYLAEILIMARNYWAAEREARAALELIDRDPSSSSYALAMLAGALLGTGKRAEALATALDAVAIVEKLETGVETEAHARLVLAEAWHENGDTENARLAIMRAAARLRARARRISHRALRRSFLHKVPVHARTLALAQAWRRE
jgi:tetratricopeptide (TPR) repeat protein